MATLPSKCVSMLLCTYLLFSPWEEARIEIIDIRRNKQKKKAAELLQEAVSPPPTANRSELCQSSALSLAHRDELQGFETSAIFSYFFPQEKNKSSFIVRKNKNSLCLCIRVFYHGIIFRNRIGFFC